MPFAYEIERGNRKTLFIEKVRFKSKIIVKKVH